MSMDVPTVATTAFQGSSSIVLNKPSGTSDGDLLVAIIASNSNSKVINSVPSGWTLIRSDANLGGNNLWVESYYKVASSEGASWTWGFDNTAGAEAGVALRITGHEPTGAIGSSNGAQVGNDGTPSWANTVTPTISSSLLIMAIIASQNASAGTSGYAIVTSNPSWTEQCDLQGGAGNASTLAVATAIRPETTASGNSSATLGTDDGTEDSTCQLIVINRQTGFTSSIQDTVAVTDTVSGLADFHMSVSDTVTVEDNLDSAEKDEWSEASPTSTSWSTQSKS